MVYPQTYKYVSDENLSTAVITLISFHSLYYTFTDPVDV